MNIEILPQEINLEKKYKTSIVKVKPKPISYAPVNYGINTRCTGKGVKIAILDSGCPHHKDMVTEGDRISFCEGNTNINDKHGHSTIISGVIKANNKNTIVGTAPHANLLFGKVVDNKGKCDFNALVAGVLWAIVKEVDIIVIAMGTQYDYMVLRDAIKKAREHNICIFAASGENEELDYPARYKEVFSTGFLTRSKEKNEKIKKNVDFYLPNKKIMTTAMGNEYVKISGSSISTAFFTGIAAVFIEQYNKEHNKGVLKKNISKLLTEEYPDEIDMPKIIYSKMINTFKEK
jgi:subtilisin